TSTRAAGLPVSLAAMRTIEGTRAALDWCEARLAAARGAARSGQVAEAVAEVIAGVRDGGEPAVLAYTERFDGVRRGTALVDRAELEAGAARVPAELARSIDAAIARVEAYYQAQ